MESTSSLPVEQPDLSTNFVDEVARAVARTHEHALAIQREEGWWQAPLEANATMDAQYIFFNRFMGRERPDVERRLIDRIRSTQRADGSWALFENGPAHLSVTVESLAALRMSGADPDEPALRRAKEVVLEMGGLERAGVFSKIFLAYFGEVPWSAIPTLPVEYMLVPPWSGVSIYEMSSWARETVVPLLVLMSKKPRIPAPGGFTMRDLWREPRDAGKLRFYRDHGTVSIESFFMTLDQAFKIGERLPANLFRPLALRKACEWILEHQDRNGGWGGIQPPMVNCPMALKAAGYPDDHEAVRSGIQALDDFLIELPDGNLICQPCVSPVWDTALMAKGLLESGMAPDHPALRKAARWLVGKQILAKGDWSIKNPDLQPGGWAFEFENDWYPDVDDTAVILMSLLGIQSADEGAKEAAIARGLQWTLGMQSRNGGWAAFDTDNTLEVLNRIPFADMEAMIDPPTADITGRILELMGSFGFDATDPRAARGLAFLDREQERDGSWFGRWGANYVYGTWSVLAGLRAIGVPTADPRVRRAVSWLESVQRADGSFGEDCRSYVDRSLAAKGPATASQTAWGVLGLLAGEEGVTPAIERGVRWLVDRQTEDGSWDETPFTGTGFPGHFYLRYWMYRTYFPLMAIGQFHARAALGAAPDGNGRAG